MLWIGAIFGALFGWIGILVAAFFWATLAIIKLIWVLSVFAFQFLLAVGAVLARAVIWLFHWASKRMASPTPAPPARKTKSSPPGLKPTRKRVPRKN
jgi:hypothetical protein